MAFFLHIHENSSIGWANRFTQNPKNRVTWPILSQNPNPKPKIKPTGILGFTKSLYFAHFDPDFRQKLPNLIVTVFGNNQIFTGNTITGNGKIFLPVLPLPSTTLERRCCCSASCLHFTAINVASLPWHCNLISFGITLWRRPILHVVHAAIKKLFETLLTSSFSIFNVFER